MFCKKVSAQTTPRLCTYAFNIPHCSKKNYLFYSNFHFCDINIFPAHLMLLILAVP